MLRRLRKIYVEDEAATAIEYAVVIGLIFGVVIVAVTALGGATAASLGDSSNSLSGALGP